MEFETKLIIVFAGMGAIAGLTTNGLVGAVLGALIMGGVGFGVRWACDS